VTKRALVTGAGGFVGQWLARALIERGWSVIGTILDEPPAASAALSREQLREIRWVRSDMRNSAELETAIATSMPEAVFHLAGVSFVPDAQGNPAQSWDINALGAVRLLAAISSGRRGNLIDPTVLVVGSAMQYGRHEPAEMPLPETAEQRPLTVYAASKAAQEVAALQAARAEGLRIVCTRSFNHSGIGHAEHFLLPALVRRALATKTSGDRRLPLGNAEAIRDYLHVNDVVEAYLLLAERGAPGEVYNVCSGEGVTARQLAADVLLRVGATAEISTRPELVRTDDVPVLIGSPRKLHDLGWRITRTRDDIIDDLIYAATH
jgi:GDP-4-dehydro-6-deoxy-D-mannose reductase